MLLRAFICVVALVSFVACGNQATFTPAPTATPTLSLPIQLRIAPAKLFRGARAVMVGSGFERGEPVAFYLTRPDGSKTPEGQFTADSNGGVAYELDVMDDWQPGQYIAHIRSRKNPARYAEQKVELFLR